MALKWRGHFAEEAFEGLAADGEVLFQLSKPLVFFGGAGGLGVEFTALGSDGDQLAADFVVALGPFSFFGGEGGVAIGGGGGCVAADEFEEFLFLEQAEDLFGFGEGVVRFVVGFEEGLLEFGREALDVGADGLDGVDGLLAVEDGEAGVGLCFVGVHEAGEGALFGIREFDFASHRKCLPKLLNRLVMLANAIVSRAVGC